VPDIPVPETWDASGLSARPREIVILRCAWRAASTYEWHQHVPIARAAGMSEDEIRAVAGAADAASFSDDERALVAYVDEIADQVRPSDEAFSAVRATRSDGEVLGITCLITLYFQLARVMAIMDLETEEPFVGWDLAGS
jgi:alkylhydroperoxidase family enzyme